MVRPLARRARRVLGAALMAAASLPAPVAAAGGCRLALALALDVSSSVDAREYALQRDGLADALLSDAVRTALFHDPLSWISVAVFEWSGRNQHAMVLDWAPIRSEAGLARAAAQIRAAQRSYSEFPTAVGYALGYGAGLIMRAPACDRQTLDVSGDGINNEGFAPYLAYANFPLDAVTVNGLVIEGGNPGLHEFYTREVIRGPGAFVEVARRYEGFARAMRRKLVREIGAMMVGAADAPTGGG